MKNEKKKTKLANVERTILNGSDAEFLIQNAGKDGRFFLRIGQVWQMPTLQRGQTRIFLDLDNCRKVRWWNICRRIAQSGVRVLQLVITGSPGGHGFHVVVVVRGKFTRFERIALQAICESDPQREANNFRRAKLAGRKWRENWNVLFM